eukprot:CAMPEP_0195542584 /NCGR_PEP_ID=MMETSP0794_2-20130614/51677_1 /TAXON_ID=515487 /ORGANISM="Stephanopyxis turris, Strain CCMP 815" /LENGTH=559 /DNA_ID=CAMNT_0040676719 /DNA_START=145 /DNA_END=1824 /DNA_ORIENTATION=-
MAMTVMAWTGMTMSLTRPLCVRSFSISAGSTGRTLSRSNVGTKKIGARSAFGIPQMSTTTETTSDAPETSSTGRISRGSISSLDARSVADNLPMILSHLKSRRASEATLHAAEKIASLNAKRVELIGSRDKALSARKEQSAVVGQIMRNIKDADDETKERLEEAKKLSGAAADDAAAAEEELSAIEGTVSTLLASLPNLLDDNVPDGNDDGDNELVEEWGDINALPKELSWNNEDGKPFEALWHDDVASNLNGWMADEAVKISGSRFVALSGVTARLERALGSFFLDIHTREHGYTEMSVPLIVSRSTLEGTSQLPKFEEDLFRIAGDSHTCNGEDAFLIPTAEVPLTNLHRDSIFAESDLPISYVALTPCFRAEAGSYGRDTRGLVRTHQFAKVEMVKITKPTESDAEHEKLTRHAQICLEKLKLPYRKVRLCSGDIGFSARHCYDLEVWLPGQGVYKEISSCSNTGDFQARRMALRYRPSADPAAATNDSDKKGKKKKPKKPKPELCHTINGSGLAVGRALVAVLENYQKPDGSVVVPEVLRPYMGGLDVLKPTDAN